ncbi:hypothetical protein MJ8_14040 [Mesorhizobium sp. J8]|nr:hypothetical protein MJ8_14040 [Mesorhizobium sp. J8]
MVWFVTFSSLAASVMVRHSLVLSAEKYASFPLTRRIELTRLAVQVLFCPVRKPIRLRDAAMWSSAQRPAMLRMTSRASSEVVHPCSPDFGLRTRNCECWPPRQ